MTTPKEPERSRSQWSSETAFIATMAAASVGLGNLWRFPYLLGKNDGGAFVVAYLVSLATVVLPVMMLEVAAGRLARGSTVGAFSHFSRFGKYYGWFVILITMLITSYYLVVTGWTFGYTLTAATDSIPTFESFSNSFASLCYFFAVIVLAVVVLIPGVSAIEKLSKILMPVLVLLVSVLVGVASQTPGWEQTAKFLLDVDWSHLKEGALWKSAFGQACYTLAIGQGYLVTYGSYIPRKTRIGRACLLIAVVQVAVALLASWMIFPFVFSQGVQPDSGSELAFRVMPKVFDDLSAGYAAGLAFFLLFFSAAFSSVLAGMKAMIATLSDQFGMSNRNAVLSVAAVMAVLGTPSALSFTSLDWTLNGRPVLEVIDSIVGEQVIIVSGMLGAALVCWCAPRDQIRFALALREGWLETWLYSVGKYLPPIVIAGLIAMTLRH